MTCFCSVSGNAVEKLYRLPHSSRRFSSRASITSVRPAENVITSFDMVALVFVCACIRRNIIDLRFPNEAKHHLSQLLQLAKRVSIQQNKSASPSVLRNSHARQRGIDRSAATHIHVLVRGRLQEAAQAVASHRH